METRGATMSGKKIFVLFGIIVAVMFFNGFPNDARGAEWVHYGTDVLENNIFYDRDSIQNVSKSLIKVWTKTVVSDEGRAKLINDYEKRGQTASGVESLSEISDLWFISCEDKKYKITQSTYYASDGRILSATHFDDDRWNDIHRKSMIEVLMKILCKKPTSSK